MDGRENLVVQSRKLSPDKDKSVSKQTGGIAVLGDIFSIAKQILRLQGQDRRTGFEPASVVIPRLLATTSSQPGKPRQLVSETAP